MPRFATAFEPSSFQHDCFQIFIDDGGGGGSGSSAGSRKQPQIDLSEFRTIPVVKKIKENIEVLKIINENDKHKAIARNLAPFIPTDENQYFLDVDVELWRWDILVFYKDILERIEQLIGRLGPEIIRIRQLEEEELLMVLLLADET